VTTTVQRVWILPLTALCIACSTGSGGGTDLDSPADVSLTDPGTDAATDAPPGSPGTCTYAGSVTGVDECKEYGAGWTRDTATADCALVQPGVTGTWDAAPACSASNVLGTCTVETSGARSHAIRTSGDDVTRCNLVRTACIVGAGGTFEPGSPCQALGAPDAAWGAVPFVPPYRMCIDAKSGEAPGQTDGHVCTWTLISGCTEAGRRFEDQGYCPDVITQRPYGPSSATATVENDPRLSDAAYMADVAWAASQVEACGCVCCHKKALAPRGPANWHIDAPGIWTDGIRDSGLALMVGLADSRALGAFPPAQNNGFNRTDVGLPTNDVPRMRNFLQAEFARRGLTEADGKAVPPFGGPLVEQLSFVPDACTGGEGVESDGSMYWGDIGARYVYVLAAGAKGPVVPPNLDTPDGTIWRMEVPNVSPTITTAVYGQVSGDQRQVIPAAGPPPALVSGTQYYLYVLIDVGFPLVRCLFTAP
jgi:hypothetical protein